MGGGGILAENIYLKNQFHACFVVDILIIKYQVGGNRQAEALISHTMLNEMALMLICNV